jgi:hypothetical protein
MDEKIKNEMKNLILIIGTLLIALNTIIGLIVIDYTTINFLLADLSIALSAGILYFVACSKMTNGFKIGLMLLFFLTGIARCLCAALAETVWQNNVLLIVALGVLFFELACVAASLFASKK